MDKIIILSDERINDLKALLNRVPLGNGNTIGESLTMIEIVNAINNAKDIKENDENSNNITNKEV